MADSPHTESARSRAWRLFKTTFTGIWGWLWLVVWGTAASVGSLLLSAGRPVREQVLILVLFALSGTVLSSLIWYLGCLVLAPVQQRDDARKELLGFQTSGRSLKLAELLANGSALRKDLLVQNSSDPADPHERVNKWIVDTAAALAPWPIDAAYFVADTGDFHIGKFMYPISEIHEMHRDEQERILRRMDRHLDRLRELLSRSIGSSP